MWPDVHLGVADLSSALSVIASMITPALLLSACGTYILSTSNRLARIVDRMRWLSQELDDISQHDVALRAERVERYRSEIKLQGHRLQMIQRALTLLYIGAVSFLCTSVSIGLASVVQKQWVYSFPVLFGILGVFTMLIASITLAMEARRAVQDLYEETEFHRRIARYYASRTQPKEAEEELP